MEKLYERHELSEPCLVKYVWSIEMPKVLSDQVRFKLNRMEGKLEVIVLKESEFVRVISKPYAQIYSIAIGQLR
jgi:hypothetical protein